MMMSFLDPAATQPDTKCYKILQTSKADKGCSGILQALLFGGDVRVSDPGYDELHKDGIHVERAVAGIATAVVVEDCPDRFRGPAVLTLQHDAEGRAIHVVWVVPANERRPAVLVTAYRPDARLWDDDFRRRKR